MLFEEYNFDNIIYIDNRIFDLISFFFYRYVKCDFIPIHAV